MLEGGESLPTFDPTGLIGRTFLKFPEEDGEHFHARIIEAISDHDKGMAENTTKIKFRFCSNDDAYEEILSYNQIIDHIEWDELDTDVWKFKSIGGHQGPLSRSDKDYKGSR